MRLNSPSLNKFWVLYLTCTLFLAGEFASAMGDRVFATCAPYFPVIEKPFLFEISKGGHSSLLLATSYASLSKMPSFVHEALQGIETLVTLDEEDLSPYFKEWHDGILAGAKPAHLERKLSPELAFLYHHYLTAFEFNPELYDYLTPLIATFILKQMMWDFNFTPEDLRLRYQLQQVVAQLNPPATFDEEQAVGHLLYELKTYLKKRGAGMSSLSAPLIRDGRQAELNTMKSVEVHIRALHRIASSKLGKPPYTQGDWQAYEQYAHQRFRLNAELVWGETQQMQVWLPELEKKHHAQNHLLFAFDLGVTIGPGRLLRLLRQAGFQIQQIATPQDWQRYKRAQGL